MFGPIHRKASGGARAHLPDTVLRGISIAALFQPLLFMALLLAASAAVADTMPWNETGTTVSFLDINESSATDPLPLFGEPTVSGNQLLFAPASFASYSQNLSSDQTNSHLQMTIAIQPGQATGITNLLFTEEGDYTLVGAPTTLANASVATPVTLMINDDSSLVMSAYMTFSSMPVGSSTFTSHSGSFSLAGDGGVGILWEGQLDADIGAFLEKENYSSPATQITVSLDDALCTWSTAGASADVEKKLFDIVATTSPVPEPGTIALLVAAVAALGMHVWRRRLRRAPS